MAQRANSRTKTGHVHTNSDAATARCGDHHMFDADYIGAADRSNRCAHTRMVDGAPIGSDYNADILGLPVRYIESHQIRVPNLIQQVGIRVLGSESVPDSDVGARGLSVSEYSNPNRCPIRMWVLVAYRYPSTRIRIGARFGCGCSWPIGIRVLGSESVPDSEPGKSQTIGIRVHGYRSVPDSDPCTWIPTCSE